MPASGPRSRGARAHPCPWQGKPALLRSSANSGLVLATQKLDCITGRGTSDPHARPLPRPAQRNGAADPQDASLPLPRPLVVPARRGRSLLVRRPGRDRDLPDALLREQHGARRVPRALRAAARAGDDGGVPLGARPLDDGQGRAPDAPDAPLGGRRLRRRDRAALDPDLLYRRLPHAARADLLDRPHDPHRHAGRGLPRLLAGRRPALGDGPCDRLCGRGLVPIRRREPRRPDLGRAVPGQARLLLADVHRARLPDPGADRDAARSAPGARRAAAPYAVQGEPPPDRAQDRRRPPVPGADAALARALLRGRWSAVPAGWARADQSHLALGPVPHLRLDERRAAGLVPRLADRRAAARAGVRPHDRALHARAEPILGRSLLPAPRLHVPLPLALYREALRRRQRLPQPARPAARCSHADGDRDDDADLGLPSVHRRQLGPDRRDLRAPIRLADLGVPHPGGGCAAAGWADLVLDMPRAAGGRAGRAAAQTRRARGRARLMLTVLQEKLGEAHGLAIAAAVVVEKVEERTLDLELRRRLWTMQEEAAEVRARCLAVEEGFGEELAAELLAHANTTREHAADLAGAWFKAGTSPLRAWSFLAMGEAGGSLGRARERDERKAADEVARDRDPEVREELVVTDRRARADAVEELDRPHDRVVEAPEEEHEADQPGHDDPDAQRLGGAFDEPRHHRHQGARDEPAQGRRPG